MKAPVARRVRARWRRVLFCCGVAQAEERERDKFYQNITFNPLT